MLRSTLDEEEARSSMPDPSEIRVTHHAFARYQEHYRAADERQLLSDLQYSIEIEPRTARAMLGRLPDRKPDETPSYYLLSTDRSGIFVVIREPAPIVLTYLRFGEEQKRFALSHWPVGSAPANEGIAPAESEVPAEPIHAIECPPGARIDVVATVVAAGYSSIKQYMRDTGQRVLDQPLNLIQVLPKLRETCGSTNLARAALAFARAVQRGPFKPARFLFEDPAGRWVEIEVRRDGGAYWAGQSGQDADDFPDGAKW
jgi:hypothetical protein